MSVIAININIIKYEYKMFHHFYDVNFFKSRNVLWEKMFIIHFFKPQFYIEWFILFYTSLLIIEFILSNHYLLRFNIWKYSIFTTFTLFWYFIVYTIIYVAIIIYKQLFVFKLIYNYVYFIYMFNHLFILSISYSISIILKLYYLPIQYFETVRLEKLEHTILLRIVVWLI